MAKEIVLVSNGDFRQEACRDSWPKQVETLEAVEAALTKLGFRSRRYPDFDKALGRQPIEGDLHRGMAHTKLFGDSRNLKTLPRTKAPREDLLADAFIGFLGQCRMLNCFIHLPDILHSEKPSPQDSMDGS